MKRELEVGGKLYFCKEGVKYEMVPFPADKIFVGKAKFKIGDKVKYIGMPNNYLVENNIYIIKNVSPSGIKVGGIWITGNLFELVEEELA